MELSKRYQPSEVEAKIRHFWEEGEFFRAATGVVGRPTFSVVIPPPNVTGRLHMGHALNLTLQDVVVRYHRMKGDETCWFPGTDHAGIATQNVVEKQLVQEGLRRQDLGREAFVQRVWAWKEKYGSEIIVQLKALGCSCDWSRLRFTLDDGLSRAVREVFVRLYKDDLVYRGAYLVNWCPRCETAVSDLEVEHEDVDGSLYHIRYPLDDGGHVVIATTRPETMLGDTALAVNPEDPRFSHLIGKVARLPILGRALPIVGAEEVDPTFGTGVLKITPAHDPVDFEIGRTHELASINILNGDGTINQHGGPFEGMDREQARDAVLDRLRSEELLEKVAPYRHAVGQCERCSSAIEPLISTQWFVRMKGMAETAVAAVKDGRIEFIPERWSKLYFDWLENIRDWCISRQLWWGHRIPVWYGPDGHPFAAHSESEAAREAEAYYGQAAVLHQDEDVLDTWFSSWLWPFSIMGWPDETEDLNAYFPTDFLLTGFDILFFWVSRMIMASLHVMNEVPFKTVYITPLLVDAQGQKMSKSKGNSVDPLELMESYGADALRLVLAHATTKGRTLRTPTTQLDDARNFLNKLWNVTRFTLMHLGDDRPEGPTTVDRLEDRFILSRLARTTDVVRQHLDAYTFNLAAQALYEFVWRDVCDWYVEMAKPRLQSTGDEVARGVLSAVLRDSLKLLHPIVPHITEEIWQVMGEEPGSISRASYPEAGAYDEDAERSMALLQEVITAVRTVRAELGVPHQATPQVLIRADETAQRVLESSSEIIRTLTSAGEVRISRTLDPPETAARQIVQGAEVYVPLADLIDVTAERHRLTAELEDVLQDLLRVEAKLENRQFLDRAPDDVVQKEHAKREEFVQRRRRLEENLSSLGG